MRFYDKKLIFCYFLLGACTDGSNPKINANMDDKMCKNGSDNKVVQAFNILLNNLVKCICLLECCHL